MLLVLIMNQFHNFIHRNTLSKTSCFTITILFRKRLMEKSAHLTMGSLHLHLYSRVNSRVQVVQKKVLNNTSVKCSTLHNSCAVHKHLLAINNQNPFSILVSRLLTIRKEPNKQKSKHLRHTVHQHRNCKNLPHHHNVHVRFLLNSTSELREETQQLPRASCKPATAI